MNRTRCKDNPGILYPGKSITAVDRRFDSERMSASKDLAFFAKLLHQRHYISATDGNLSVRMETDQILTTPSGLCKAFLHSRDMVIVDSKGNRVRGAREPSSEIGMHLTIYKFRPDVRAVVHAHPCVATALASAGMDLTEPICAELVLGLGRIPLAPYALPGTAAVSRALAPYIMDHDAILMQNHGVVTYADTLQRAYLHMESVEHCARIMLATKLLGRCRVLNDREVMSLLAFKNRKK